MREEVSPVREASFELVVSESAPLSVGGVPFLSIALASPEQPCTIGEEDLLSARLILIKLRTRVHLIVTSYG